MSYWDGNGPKKPCRPIADHTTEICARDGGAYGPAFRLALGAAIDFRKVRQEVKLASGDYVDMKMFEPAMRRLLDTYIRAEESEKISAFDDLTLGEVIVERGEAAVDVLPEGIRKNREAMAETIENNVRPGRAWRGRRTRGPDLRDREGPA